MKKLREYTIKDKATIKGAISVIQNNLSRCVIVLNDKERVIGVFSEGDVLRSILEGIDIHTPLKRVLSPSFKYMKDQDMTKAYDFVKKYGITLIPVIDDEFSLRNVITIFDIMSHLKLVNGDRL